MILCAVVNQHYGDWQILSLALYVCTRRSSVAGVILLVDPENERDLDLPYNQAVTASQPT